MERGKALASAALLPPVEGILSREECPIRQGKILHGQGRNLGRRPYGKFQDSSGAPPHIRREGSQRCEPGFRSIGGIAAVKLEASWGRFRHYRGRR